MFDGFSRAGSSATITSTAPIIGSHACAGTAPAASANHDPAAPPVVSSYGINDYYALTPAANSMIGIPSQTGSVSSLAGTPITVTCAGGISPLSESNTPQAGALFRTAYRPAYYNGFPCLVNTTSGNLVGAVATGDVSIPGQCSAF